MLDMLEVWFTNIKRVGIPNYVVVASDEEIADSVNQNMFWCIGEIHMKVLIQLRGQEETMLSQG